jgi:hypothetical protein
MAVKKLIVCGDSFSAPAQKLPGTAWGEVLAHKLGWEVQILARQGCSNGGIRVQIDEVLRQRPTFAIIVPTYHDRIEIPAAAAPYTASANENKGWDSDLQKHLQKNHGIGYDPSAGINNINYGTNPYRMICETIFSLAENIPHQYRSGLIDKDTQSAVKQYINFLYDSQWKLQQDQWIIRDGIMQLHYAEIPFLLASDSIWHARNIRSQFPKVIPDHCLALDSSLMPAVVGNTDKWKLPSVKDDPGYHTTVEGQQHIADMYHNIIKQHWDL